MKRCLYNFVKAVLLMYFVCLVCLFLSPADWANHLLLTLGKFGPFASLLPLLCFDALFFRVTSKRDAFHFVKEQTENLKRIGNIPFQKGDKLLFMSSPQESKYGFDGPIKLEDTYLFATEGLLRRITKEHLEQYLQLYRSIVAQEPNQQSKVQLSICQKTWLHIKICSYIYGRVTVYFSPTGYADRLTAPFLHGKVMNDWYF